MLNKEECVVGSHAETNKICFTLTIIYRKNTALTVLSACILNDRRVKQYGNRNVGPLNLDSSALVCQTQQWAIRAK